MSLTTQDIDFLKDLIVERSGNVIAHRQAYLLEQRLKPVAKKAGLGDVGELVCSLRLRQDEALCNQIAQAVTVNETSFFRDIHPFEALKKTILPALINTRKSTKKLSIWCAACSTGQEPYSIAMVIREHFPELVNWKVRILATDVSEPILAESKSGKFSQLEVNRGLPVRKLVQFFDRHGGDWIAKPELRSLIEHRKLNLTKPWPIVDRFDVVFLRNVMIYFDTLNKENIFRRMCKVIQPEGYLFLGASETTIGLEIPFQRKQINETICYRPN